MKFGGGGVGVSRSRPSPRSQIILFKEGVARSKLADMQGFSYAGAGDMHCDYDCWWPSPNSAFASLCFTTHQIRFRAGAMALSAHEPLRVAEDMAMLDVLSNGRAHGGFGMGYRPLIFFATGTNKKTRGVRLVEEMEIIRLALSQEAFSYHGKYYHFQDVRVRPRPIRKPYPPLWMLGGRSLRVAQRAGSHGFRYKTSDVYGEDLKRASDVYYQAAVEAGVDKSQLAVSADVPMFVGRTLEEAAMYREGFFKAHVFEHYVAYGYLLDEDGNQIYDPYARHPVTKAWMQSVPLRTVEQAIEEISFYEKIGIESINMPGGDRDLVFKEIMPRFMEIKSANK